MIKTDLFTRNIIKRTQQELQMWLPDLMRGLGYQKVYAPSEYILCVGEIPVMVVCHMDTVHQHVPKTVLCQHGIMWSPEGIGGDDRCGIYGAIEIAKRCQKRPFILFTTDEEIGGIGVQAFCRDFPENEYDIRFLVELDRKGYNDICFYQCDNPDFMEYAMKETTYLEAYGSYTDIVDIMDTWNVAGCNLSCGYYNAHSTSEYIVLKHLDRVINICIDWFDRTDWENTPIYETYSPFTTPGKTGGRYGSYQDYSRSHIWDFDYSYDDYESQAPEGYFECLDCGVHERLEYRKAFDGLCRDCYAMNCGDFDLDIIMDEASCVECGEPISDVTFQRNQGRCNDCQAFYQELEKMTRI